MPDSDDAFTFGFRIVGPTTNDRRLTDWSAAFRGCCECDDRAEPNRESYLSAFCFGDAFRAHLAATGSPKGYAGATWAPWLWFDIDRDDIDQATRDARRLAAGLTDRFGLDGDELLAFFSGSKGFHVGLPLSVCGLPGPSTNFHLACRRFAEAVASRSSVAVDSGVYDRIRPFRAPNSRHRKTGLHKRRLTFGELMGLSTRRILELAATPEGFDIPDPAPVADQAVRDWLAAVESVEKEHRAAETRRGTIGKADAKLNRSTLEFIRDGATTGDRHRRLFSAAANLAEFGCSLELAVALLTEAALDSGLSPSDVRRQIECGFNHKP
jgi:hypothetical protein